MWLLSDKQFFVTEKSLHKKLRYTLNMDKNWEEKLAKELPKVELHLHLDGSISPG